MKRSTLAAFAATCLCLGFGPPPLAAEPQVAAAANNPSTSEKTVSAAKPAEKCLTDLRAFDSKMEKDGYWLGGSGYGYGYGYGYPLDGLGFAGQGDPMGDRTAATAAGYRNARPGYEVRTLIAAANILAWHRQQQSCEKVLATSRDVYSLYAADLHSGQLPIADVPHWRQQQIAAAKPVTAKDASFRSDELIGIEVRSAQDAALGSVDDIVMSPKTGEIAYLVIARGGIFGIDEKYAPVPWADFKIAPNVNLLVLDTNKDALKGAPQVKNDQFTGPGHFNQESQKIDDYWKTHLSIKGTNGPNG